MTSSLSTRLPSARMSWSRIKEAFGGEWVELVDVSWSRSDLNPRAAVVRHHHTDRAKLLAAIKSSNRSTVQMSTQITGSESSNISQELDSVVLFVSQNSVPFAVSNIGTEYSGSLENR